MDTISTFGWFLFGGATAVWLTLGGAALVRGQRKPAVIGAVLMMLFCGALIANEKWGSAARHRSSCATLRLQYDKATSIVDLERVRDRLRQGGCTIVRP